MKVTTLMDKAILEGKKVVPVADTLEWARWFERANRRVDESFIGNIRISTVFLGLDHGFSGGRRLWFETMIFGGSHDGYQERYETWEQAEQGHLKALALVGGIN